MRRGVKHDHAPESTRTTYNYSANISVEELRPTNNHDF